MRDLAAWIVSAADQGLSGPFNVTGPLEPLTVLDAARACIAGTGSQATPVVVPSQVARDAGVIAWEHVPFWLEPGDYAGMQASIDRAVATGLTTRPSSTRCATRTRGCKRARISAASTFRSTRARRAAISRAGLTLLVQLLRSHVQKR